MYETVGSELYDWGDPSEPGRHGHIIIDDYAEHSDYVGATAIEHSHASGNWLVGAVSAAGETPDSPRHWWAVTGSPADHADRKYRTLSGDINAAMINIPATDPKYLPIAQLQQDYTLWLATVWDAVYPGDLLTNTDMIDPTPYDADYDVYASRYTSITGMDPTQEITSAQAAAANVSHAITNAITAPATSWFAAHAWEMYLACGAVIAYLFLFANAKLAGGISRSLR